MGSGECGWPNGVAEVIRGCRYRGIMRGYLSLGRFWPPIRNPKSETRTGGRAWNAKFGSPGRSYSKLVAVTRTSECEKRRRPNRSFSLINANLAEIATRLKKS